MCRFDDKLFWSELKTKRDAFEVREYERKSEVFSTMAAPWSFNANSLAGEHFSFLRWSQCATTRSTGTGMFMRSSRYAEPMDKGRTEIPFSLDEINEQKA